MLGASLAFAEPTLEVFERAPQYLFASVGSLAPVGGNDEAQPVIANYSNYLAFLKSSDPAWYFSPTILGAWPTWGLVGDQAAAMTLRTDSLLKVSASTACSWTLTARPNGTVPAGMNLWLDVTPLGGTANRYLLPVTINGNGNEYLGVSGRVEMNRQGFVPVEVTESYAVDFLLAANGGCQ
ncbi:MAG TPA: hypothetical protein VHN99_00865 [Deinococcales bacterium]|nr:hypothetical protein [Deinococcales bacterium]